MWSLSKKLRCPWNFLVFCDWKFIEFCLKKQQFKKALKIPPSSSSTRKFAKGQWTHEKFPSIHHIPDSTRFHVKNWMHNQLNFIFYFNCIHFTFFYSKINSISINILIFYRNTLSTLLRSSIMKISSFYYEYKMICKKAITETI